MWSGGRVALSPRLLPHVSPLAGQQRRLPRAGVWGQSVCSSATVQRLLTLALVLVLVLLVALVLVLVLELVLELVLVLVLVLHQHLLVLLLVLVLVLHLLLLHLHQHLLVLLHLAVGVHLLQVGRAHLRPAGSRAVWDKGCRPQLGAANARFLAPVKMPKELYPHAGGQTGWLAQARTRLALGKQQTA